MASKPDFLYGLPYHESMYRSLAQLVEAEGLRPDSSPYRVERWTVVDNESLLPTAERMLEWVTEWPDLVIEQWWEAAENAARDEGIQMLFQGAINQFAKAIDFWMADTRVSILDILVPSPGTYQIIRHQETP